MHAVRLYGDAAATAALIIAAFFALRPKLRRNEAWRATVTPLASIIGSGFLVSLPLLARNLGVYAIGAITLLLVLAYLLGGAVRFNIKYGEPLFDGEGARLISWFDKIARLTLVLAYVVSVSYYLSLLAAFSLKAINIAEAHTIARVIASVFLVAIGGWGFVRGLRGLESIEEYAVGLKLAVIAAVLAALVVFNVALTAHGDWRIQAAAPPLDFHHLRIVLGLLIVVQGFETSRFLKGTYPAPLRIRTMRWAQLISGAIYLAFFALALPILHTAPDNADVAGVTEMVAVAATILPLVLIAGAVFAQLSAAIADAIGAAGLLRESTSLSGRWAYLLIAAAGCALIWSVDVFRVIQLASSAFALFYAMQAGLAVLVAAKTKDVSWRAPRMAGFAALALIALAAAVLGIPAETAG